MEIILNFRKIVFIFYFEIILIERGCGVVVSTSEHDANEHRFEPYTEKTISKIIFIQQRRGKNLLVNAEIWKAIPR